MTLCELFHAVFIQEQHDNESEYRVLLHILSLVPQCILYWYTSRLSIQKFKEICSYDVHKLFTFSEKFTSDSPEKKFDNCLALKSVKWVTLIISRPWIKRAAKYFVSSMKVHVEHTYEEYRWKDIILWCYALTGLYLGVRSHKIYYVVSTMTMS